MQTVYDEKCVVSTVMVSKTIKSWRNKADYTQWKTNDCRWLASLRLHWRKDPQKLPHEKKKKTVKLRIS